MHGRWRRAASRRATPPPTVDPLDPPKTPARVHGPVSSAPPAWQAVPNVKGIVLQDVLYHKTPDGIAKARWGGT